MCHHSRGSDASCSLELFTWRYRLSGTLVRVIRVNIRLGESFIFNSCTVLPVFSYEEYDSNDSLSDGLCQHEEFPNRTITSLLWFRFRLEPITESCPEVLSPNCCPIFEDARNIIGCLAFASVSIETGYGECVNRISNVTW